MRAYARACCLGALLILPPLQAAEPATPAQAEPAATPRAPLPTRSEEAALGLQRSLPAEEQVRLPLPQGDFLALWRPAESAHPKGLVVILPGADEHADWPDVVGPLRRELPHAEWHTLSLMLPDPPVPALPAPAPAADAKSDAAPAATPDAAYAAAIAARLGAARAYAQQAQLKPVVFLTHGSAAYWAALALSSDSTLAQGLLMIDAEQPALASAALPQLLSSLSLPVGDYSYAEHDTAGQRLRRLANLGHANYAQVNLDALADSDGEEQRLASRVRGWLSHSFH